MMIPRQIVFILSSYILFLSSVHAQKALTVDDLVNWRRITEKAVSDNGKWVATTIAPWEGDPTVSLYNYKGEKVASYTPAEKFSFSSSSQYLLITKILSKVEKDSLKLRKTKEDKMPMSSLVIRRLSGEEESVDSLRSHLLAETAEWLAYQRGKKDSTLYVRSLDGKKNFSFPAVSEYKFALKSPQLYFISSGDSLEFEAGLYTLDPLQKQPVLVKEGKGVFKQTTFSEDGSGIAFLYCEEKDSIYKALDLWIAEKGMVAQKVADRSSEALSDGWIISEYGEISFSRNNNRVFFGISPEPLQKDTTQLEEYRPKVEVWKWDEPIQYTVQSFNKEKDKKRNYRAVYNRDNKKLLQLATVELPDITLGDEGNASLGLISTSEPYSLSSMWEVRTRTDYYTISLETGKKELLKKGDYANYRLSPEGKYAWGYRETDSCWFTIDLMNGKEYALTTSQTFPAWDEQNDQPNYPRAYGVAGWTSGDNSIIIYDRYDIWQFDPTGNRSPVNLTVNGRKERITYRIITLDKDARSLDLSKPQLLSSFNEKTKGFGYCEANLLSPSIPKVLLSGNYKLSSPVKAKNADAILYTKETFEQYPELQLSDISFRKSIQLTDEGKQQNGIKWGTAELVSWVSLDGKPLEGVVYKPVDFDPKKKYPLIVNFYERNSETLYSYHLPEAHRSTIDYHLYNSNDYIIFNPDVVYEIGYPGESCYNCVMPGIAALISKGYIDEKAIAAQGHSWGGYQVAYLATRTRLFAAIESGAPVVNMFSAYGGIRWGSGMARAFQYEHTQSRIGGTPWTTPLKFQENSPLFTMDKVETPILIMHNDSDGHVPWYQGIEYFVALKRLGKPAWMLNYPGEPHWPMRLANRVDFQKRMLQFFDHYLKDRTMPKWMKEGVKAVEQDFELGY